MTSKTYLTLFKGDVKLPPLDSAAMDSLEMYLSKNLDSDLGGDISIAKDDGMLYLNGVVDNTQEVIEDLLHKIVTNLPEGHEEVIVTAQGEDAKDRYDLVLRENNLYVRRYELVPQNEELYTPKPEGSTSEG